MHTIKFRCCLAKQDNKTLEVTVSKSGHQSITYPYTEKLSGKELRTVVSRYLSDVSTDKECA
jgi:hypothetical protein